MRGLTPSSAPTPSARRSVSNEARSCQLSCQVASSLTGQWSSPHRFPWGASDLWPIIKAMSTLADRIIQLVQDRPGLSDREITDALLGRNIAQQPTNQACRRLESRALIRRSPRADGIKGNYPTESEFRDDRSAQPAIPDPGDDCFCEDALKRTLDTLLRSQGWDTRVAWGRTHGVDIEATRGRERWIIEVKGRGSRSEMRVNYFIGMLGELLQRMDDPEAKYSIALPDLPQFRGLWQRLPGLAKQRTEITSLLVDEAGNVREEA